MSTFLAIMDGRARHSVEEASILECISEDETITAYLHDAKQMIDQGTYGDAVLVEFDEQMGPDGLVLSRGRVIYDSQ